VPLVRGLAAATYFDLAVDAEEVVHRRPAPSSLVVALRAPRVEVFGPTQRFHPRKYLHLVSRLGCIGACGARTGVVARGSSREHQRVDGYARARVNSPSRGRTETPPPRKR
jgi:hypothetical protein